MTFEKGLKVASVVSMILIAIIVFANIKDDEIKITYFEAENSYTKNNTISDNETVIFNVLWHIPKDMQLKGVAELTLKGESNGGGHWSIKDQEGLATYFASHYDGYDFHEKIPRWAKPDSLGTATLELKVDGHETVKKILMFKIPK